MKSTQCWSRGGAPSRKECLCNCEMIVKQATNAVPPPPPCPHVSPLRVYGMAIHTCMFISTTSSRCSRCGTTDDWVEDEVRHRHSGCLRRHVQVGGQGWRGVARRRSHFSPCSLIGVSEQYTDGPCYIIGWRRVVSEMANSNVSHTPGSQKTSTKYDAGIVACDISRSSCLFE